MNQDWLDDADNMRGASYVDVSYTSYDDNGDVIFMSDVRLTEAQAVAMFHGIAQVESDE